MGAEKERNEAKEEAQIACLSVVSVGEPKARAKGDLDWVRDALVVTEEAKRKAEAKTIRMEVE